MKLAERHGLVLILFMMLTAIPVMAQTPVGTGITYQGYLTDGGTPANGLYDLQFTLFDAESGGNPVGSPILKDGLYLTGGSFFTTLDFGANAFDGKARWMGIGLRPGSQTGAFTILSPRQPVTAAPYALYGVTAGGLGNGLVTTDPVRRAVTLQNSQLELLNDGQNIRAMASFGAGGEGAIALWGPNNALNVDLSAASDNANLGYAGVADERGEIQAAMSVADTGAGGLNVWGPNDKLNASITSLDGEPNHGYVGVGDEQGRTQGSLYVMRDGEGALSLWGPNDKINVDISASGDDPNVGYVGVADDRGQIQAAMSVFSSGEGGITTWGPNDKVNVDISSDASSPNHGFVGVGDSSGVVRAGLYVNGDGKGIVFGDYKYFVVDHPKKADTQIVYVSLEGPEAGIYQRGVAKLVDGRATVTLPEHFVALADPKSITVQLTPASFESKGVAFAIQPEGKIEIRELASGTGSYDVHYLVHATRAAAADFQPVVANKDFKARFGRKTARQEASDEKAATGATAKEIARPAPRTAKKASR